MLRILSTEFAELQTPGGSGLSLGVEDEQNFIQGMIERDRDVFYLAWDGEEIVGTVNLSSFPRRMSHRGEIGITVAKSHWCMGVGSMLMASVIEYAKAHGTEIINLEVRSDNASAIHLYENFGFKKTGTIPAFFKIGEEYYDFDMMYLDLR